MQTALVTGGAGFIGSHLVQTLAASGVQVRVLDNAPATAPRNILDMQVTRLFGDVRDPDVCRRACREMDVVFHLAALVSVPKSVADPGEADAINTGGTLNMLLAARDSGARRFVFSSSAAVYGDAGLVPTPEESPLRPTSPYGVQKLMGEHYARLFTALYGLETVCLRYFNVYGAGQDPRAEYAAAIPRFMTRLFAGESPVVFGDGEQTRDFCHVSDVVQANLRAATTTRTEALGSVFNVAGGRQVTLNELLRHMQQATGARQPIRHEAARVGDIRHSGADIRRAVGVLGFAPQVDLAQGLADAAAYYGREMDLTHLRPTAANRRAA